MNISIILASYNGADYIDEQLRSIIPYMEDEDELIISDDGSSDSTLAIVRELCKKDSRIMLVEGPHKGVVRNFENAMKYSTKDIILFSDQDDIWLPNKLPCMRKIFETNDVDLVLHDMYMSIVGENKEYEKTVRSFSVRKRKHGVFYNWMYSGYYGCCMGISRNLKEIILPFSEYTNMYDQWIGLVGEYLKKSIFINEPLIVHRIHGENMSQDQSLINRMKVRFGLYRAFRDTVKKAREK